MTPDDVLVLDHSVLARFHDGKPYGHDALDALNGAATLVVPPAVRAEVPGDLTAVRDRIEGVPTRVGEDGPETSWERVSEGRAAVVERVPAADCDEAVLDAAADARREDGGLLLGDAGTDLFDSRPDFRLPYETDLPDGGAVEVDLHPGESEAAALADALGAVLLTDDVDARRFADETLGVESAGTLSVLAGAVDAGVVAEETVADYLGKLDDRDRRIVSRHGTDIDRLVDSLGDADRVRDAADRIVDRLSPDADAPDGGRLPDR